MSKTKTQMYAEGHAYSLFDPEEVHRDMRQDLRQARLVMARSPQIVDMHRECQECADIAAKAAADQVHDDDAGYLSLDDAVKAHSRRSGQMVISRANLARLVGLGPGEHISRMFVSDDPQLLHLVVEAEHFQPVIDGSESPILIASPGAGMTLRGRRGEVDPEAEEYRKLVELNRASRDDARRRAAGGR